MHFGTPGDVGQGFANTKAWRPRRHPLCSLSLSLRRRLSASPRLSDAAQRRRCALRIRRRSGIPPPRAPAAMVPGAFLRTFTRSSWPPTFLPLAHAQRGDIHGASPSPRDSTMALCGGFRLPSPSPSARDIRPCDPAAHHHDPPFPPPAHARACLDACLLIAHRFVFTGHADVLFPLPRSTIPS